jgi:hypothetical protein
MTRTDELPPFETRLLAELTTVVEERRLAAQPHAVEPLATRRSRPRLRLAAASVAVIAAAVGIVAVPGLSGGSSQAFAIRELPNGLIEVSVQRDILDGSALEGELRAFGVDVSIVAVPSSPSAVGRVQGIEGPLAADEEPGFAWGPDGSDLAFSIDPAVFRGQLVLHLGVEAAPGERYLASEEVFEPGEVLGGLHCALGTPLRAEDLLPYLERLGLDATWEIASPVAGEPDSLMSEAVTEVPNGEVLWGYSLDDRNVAFTVRPDGVTLSDHWQPRLSDLSCVVHDTATWN